MKLFSLRTLIDDILLMIRNNNISESEDFSRAQIRAWIMQYKAALIKKANDNAEQNAEDEDADDTLVSTKGPLELEEVESLDNNHLFTRRTKDEIPQLLDKSPRSIISVTDQSGCVIQQMPQERRHYQWFRRYTYAELTYYYENGYIYIQGNQDCDRLKYIYVTGIWEDNSDDIDEDDIEVPGWMVPDIKQLIMKNELSFMLKLPSDDTNNATLQGIKQHGPQDTQK